jgi:hypothetical protein
VLYAPDHLDPARNDEENRVLEKERLTLQMQVRSVKKAVPGRDGLPAFVDAIIAERIFALTDKYTGFKLIVEDDNRNAPTDPGFKNVNPPRWSLKQIAEPAPRVSLLRDSFGSDDVFESPPVPIGEHIRIPYECSNKYGLGRAEVLYRLLKKHESGEMPAEDEDWISLRLPDIPTPTASGDIESVEGIEGKATIVTTKNRHNIGAGNVSISDVVGFPEVNGDFENKVLGPSRFTLTRSKKAGKGTGGTWFWAAAFDSKTGVFLHTDDDTPVEFHAVPSPNPEAILGRTFGGGRHHLSTTGLLDKKTGKAVQLKSGDLIEYCVKVYAPARQPEASTPFAVSGTRVTEVRTRDEVGEWYEKVAKENAKVRELYNRQLEVRAPK